MKKIAALILSVMMVFAIAASSLANSVSLGYLVNGEGKTENENGSEDTYDAKNIIIGGNFEINKKFSVSGELTDCNLKNGDFKMSPHDDSSYKFKGSYAILKNKQICLNLSTGYFHHVMLSKPSDWERKDNAFFLGTDATFNYDKNLNITAGFEYGPSPNSKLNDKGSKRDVDMDSLLNYQVNFNYSITKEIGLSLGYRSSCWKFDGVKQSISGITTGVTYKF